MALIDSAIDSVFQPIRCPFCAKEFRLGDCPVISGVNSGKVLHEAPKGSVQRIWSNIWIKPLEGETNTLELASRYCPHCNKRLPDNIEYIDDNITIAVIGASYSGKSHYIAALLNQLMTGPIPGEHGIIQVKAADDEVEKIYQDTYAPLFEDLEPIELTPRNFDPIADPLIYEVLIGESERTKEKHINLLIYDASGEDLISKKSLVMYKPHILNAKAIIFLADPWSMQKFVDQLPHHKRPALNIRRQLSSSVLTQVLDIFRRKMGEVGRTRFSLPVAIALSKSDLIPYLSQIGEQYKFLGEAPPDGSDSSTDDNQNVNQAVIDLLSTIQEQTLVNIARVLEKARFFAISATGSSVNDQNKFPEIKPQRCLAPLLWTLRELGVIDEK